MITIHLCDLGIGFIIGTVFGSFLSLLMFFRDDGRWSQGFSDGWKEGRKWRDEEQEASHEHDN